MKPQNNAAQYFQFQNFEEFQFYKPKKNKQQAQIWIRFAGTIFFSWRSIVPRTKSNVAKWTSSID